MTDPVYQIYNNGVVLRRRNKRVALVDIPGSEKPVKTIYIKQFKTKACSSFVVKRGIGIDAFDLYEETIEDIIRAYMTYKKIKVIRLDEMPAQNQ